MTKLAEVELTLNSPKKYVVRYDSDGDILKSIYVGKSVFPDGTYPDKITVKVETNG